ncbi:hypothetical protein [Kitasatospora purpeofusca]|uniref:hypothetical protein n=1 Tax=Kitasatospora purpeofusca TaxID=67352 RepID=UPI00224DF644|nr:hypothetical protein [Kitasatospora purpeofusca]MCX4752901.1 hypothetical protein [Kitasatospora purpeofusca]WSR32445.1 hypothetical protein OG715_16515 [Kitasatospora purpeofusca]
MRTTVTTLLDVLGLLLLAAGAAAAAWLLIGWTCLAVAGAVVLAGSWLVDRRGGGA